MDVAHLYETLVDDFSSKGLHFSEVPGGYSIEYREDYENYAAKIVQDFYYIAGYNVMLLNQNGKCRLCLEVQSKDSLSLLRDIQNSFASYIEQVDYISVMDREVKASYNLFKQSLRYPGNFGIGVKNLAENSGN